MWDITDKFKGNLPPNFSLKEDEHFVYLFHGDEKVATFSSTGADSQEIENTALEYLRK